jgi:hypothetical protein
VESPDWSVFRDNLIQRRIEQVSDSAANSHRGPDVVASCSASLCVPHPSNAQNRTGTPAGQWAPAKHAEEVRQR